MSSSLSNPELDIFRDLLNVASLRGSQGSGVAVVQNHHFKGPSVHTLKTKYIAGALAYSPEFTALVQPRASAVIGHARLPTKGGLDEDAVHPHRFGHIVGVHNGTMHRVAGQEVKDQSDSAMLFKAISEVGVEEAIKESAGAYALVWTDEKEGTLNFLRNSWRPLYFKNVGWGDKNANTVFWSSETEMLDFIFKRSYKGNNAWDTFLPPDTLYKYPLDVKHVVRAIEVKKDVRPTPPKVTTYYPRGNGHGESAFLRDWDDDGEVTTHNNARYVWNVDKQQYELLPPLVRGRNDGTGGDADTTSDSTSAELPWAGVNRTLRLPPPDLSKMTKAERKKYMKEAKLEEVKALRRLAAFRRANEIEEMRQARAAKEKDLKPHFADLIDDTVDHGGSSGGDANSSADRSGVGDMGSSSRTLRVVGRVCVWCDHAAEVGEKVFLSNNDIGCKDFICFECGTCNSAAAAFTSDARMATVVN